MQTEKEEKKAEDLKFGKGSIYVDIAERMSLPYGGLQ